MNAEPFLKWAGGKRQLLPELLKRVPATFGRYYEPFLGGGALFFALASAGRIKHGALLSDINSELITTYKVVRDEPEKLERALRLMSAKYRSDPAPDYYLSVRALKPVDDVSLAARMIFLNKTGFNGLYRVNRKGEFNVPPGKFKSPPVICDVDRIRAASAALKGVKLARRIYDEFAWWQAIEPHDFVYFDPPYVPASATANFTSYTKTGFGPEDQACLAKEARRLKNEGVHVMLSNADVHEARKHYGAPFKIERVTARRNINSKGGSRGAVGEIIVT